MKIYIMTDLEGVAGVLDFENWCEPSSRYYEAAKELLTLGNLSDLSDLSDSGAKP